MAPCHGLPHQQRFSSRSKEPLGNLDDTVEVGGGQNSPLNTSPGELEKFCCLLLSGGSTEATAVGQKDPLQELSAQAQCSVRI